MQFLSSLKALGFLAHILMNFVKVTKANKNRDRGFIAVDAICAAFEDRENNVSQIMTMDGYWYDVIDDIEKLYGKIEHYNEATITIDEEQDSQPKKVDFFRKKRMVTPALSEKGGMSPIGNSDEEEQQDLPSKKFQRRYGRGRIKTVKGKYTSRNLPSSDGKGHYSLNPEEGEGKNPTPPLEGL